MWVKNCFILPPIVGLSIVNDQAPIFDMKCYAKRQLHKASSHLLIEMLSDHTIDRLKDVNRAFTKIAIIGPYTSKLLDFLQQTYQSSPDIFAELDVTNIDLKVNHYDLIISNHYLHRVNALPENLLIMHHALIADGLFLGTTYGDETLGELKDSFLKTQIAYDYPIKPHISPFITLETAGSLLYKMGYQLPVASCEKHHVIYAQIEDLFDDLRQLGETNYLTTRHRGMLGATFFQHLKTYYHTTYSEENNKIFTTIEVISLLGWKKHENQQQPLKRGSADTHLGTIFK